jgi:hypothetical protein
MKTFIFGYDRFETMTTSEYFKEIEHTILCYTDEDKTKFQNGGKCFGEIVATQRPYGLTQNRNFALDQMELGEWALFMVDDLLSITVLDDYWETDKQKLGVDFDNCKEFRAKLKYQLSAEGFMDIVGDSIKEAEANDHNLIGFSLTGNPMFRNNKYSYKGLADGRCWVVRKTHLKFDLNSGMMEDYCFNALNHKYFGGKTVNNWCLFDCKRYGKGGYGTLEHRMEGKIKEAKYLTETYPEYLEIAEKKGQPLGSHLRLKSFKQADINQISLF